MPTSSSEGASTFNLIDEPWIPCLMRDGQAQDFSIREVFGRSTGIVTVEAELPTVTFSILRLLVAILYRAVALEEGDSPEDAWRELWNEPDLPMDLIDGYLAKVHDRFDLLDPVQPFYQVASLRTAKNDYSGLAKIIADVPNGSPYFTTRAAWRLRAIGRAEAARWLVHCQAFDPSGIKSGATDDPRAKGGKGYPIGTAWTGGIGGIWIEADDLRTTLLLNLTLGRPGERDEAWSVAGDRPVWERPEQSGAEEKPGARTGEFIGRAPEGPADQLTWQSRRIRLKVESGSVTGVLIANGDPLWPQNRFRAEPMTGWRRSEPQSRKYNGDVYMPRLHDPERAMWRGLGAILPDAEAAGGTADRAPGIPSPNLTWLQSLASGSALHDVQVRIRAIGMAYGSNNSVVDDIYDDSLWLHSILLTDRPLQDAALRAVAVAERAVVALASLARNLDVAAGGDGAGARSRARAQGYFGLDGAYREWLAELTPGTDPFLAFEQWISRARPVIVELADAEVAAAGPAAWRGRHDGQRHVDVGLASRWFTGELNKVMPSKGTADHERQEAS